MKLVNLDTGEVLADHLGEARTFFRRLKGLMFTKHLMPEDGLYLVPCRSVHSFFMNYSIDVLYLNNQLQIIAMDMRLKPGKFGQVNRNTTSVVELPAGMLESSQTRVGQTVRFQNNE